MGRKVLNKSGTAPYAVCLLIDKDQYGRFHAVELTEVTFKKVRHLEPSGAAEGRGDALNRLEVALFNRTMNDRDAPDWYTATMKRGRR